VAEKREGLKASSILLYLGVGVLIYIGRSGVTSSMSYNKKTQILTAYGTEIDPTESQVTILDNGWTLSIDANYDQWGDWIQSTYLLQNDLGDVVESGSIDPDEGLDRFVL